MNNKDRQFIEELYDTNYSFVKTLVKASLYSNNIDDITSCVNDVFIIAIQKVDILKTHNNIKAWFTLTTKYTVLSENRKFVKSRKKLKQITEESLCSYEDTYVDDIVNNIVFNDINFIELKQSILNELSDKEFDLFKLKYILQTANSLIAEKYSISENNVRAKLSRLHKKILKIKDKKLKFMGKL